MKQRHFSWVITVAASAVAVSVALASQSDDRFMLKSSNGIAFSEFTGYDAWQLISTSQAGNDGCGTSTTGCAKAILGNAIMIKAYRDGFPANGKQVPDGAAMAKIEWLITPNEASPYHVTEPGAQTEVAFMLKDSLRFKDTKGWGFATLQYDAASNTYKLHAGQSNPSFAKACISCHIAGASTTDFVYTTFARR